MKSMISFTQEGMTEAWKRRLAVAKGDSSRICVISQYCGKNSELTVYTALAEQSVESTIKQYVRQPQWET